MADEYIDKVEVGAKIQMMYIRREMDYGGENDFCRGMRKALRIIENMPTADVQPVKHGKWNTHDVVKVLCSGETLDGFCQCTACGDVFPLHYSEYNYCPNCGARMDGDSK